MRRKRQRAQVNHERWLVSYADFITLLFAFFVVLFASSQSDKKKKAQFAVAMQSAFRNNGIFDPHANSAPAKDVVAPITLATPAMTDEDDRLEALRTQQRINEVIRREVERRHLGAGLITARINAEGLVISMHDPAFFDSGSATVRGTSMDVLLAMISALPHRAMRVEGHTDNVPIHSVLFPTNWELSTARAATITRLLLAQHAVEPEQVSAAGYAEFHPVASNETLEGRTQNRRVDIIVLKAVAPTNPASAR
jgi:chemotaxis protein MotB